MNELSKDFGLNQIKPEESFDGVYYVTSSEPVNGKLYVTADKVYFFFDDKAKKAPRCIDIKNIKTMKKGLLKRLTVTAADGTSFTLGLWKKDSFINAVEKRKK